MYDEALRDQKELVLCEDGTNTLYSKEFDEPYHSTKDGALHESLEKHVKPAFSLKNNQEKLIILDICFVKLIIYLTLITFGLPGIYCCNTFGILIEPSSC